MKDFFSDSEYEVSYGELQLQPVLYQDDVARLSLDIESTQMGNNKMETMAETATENVVETIVKVIVGTVVEIMEETVAEIVVETVVEILLETMV